MKNRADEIIETIRLSEREKAKLIWAVNTTREPLDDSTVRRLRVAPTQTSAVLTLIGDSGTRTRYIVITRDISRWGASLLHGRYVYPETKCELEIRSMDGKTQTRVGQVRHVQHIQGMIHNLGVRFDECIDLSEYATLTPDQETQHLQEMADDMAEAGIDSGIMRMVRRVLVVDDFASDRKLFSYWLSKADLEVSTANDIQSAEERLEEEEFDLLMIDGQLGLESGYDLIQSLRRKGHVGAILSVSSDDDGVMEQKMRGAGADAFLSKPFTKEQLSEKAFELMGIRHEEADVPIYSNCESDEEMRPLLTAFTNKLGQQMQALHAANAKNDYDAIDEIVRGLKGAGSSYGFEVVSDHAQKVKSALESESADMANIRQSVNELIGILERVKLR